MIPFLSKFFTLIATYIVITYFMRHMKAPFSYFRVYVSIYKCPLILNQNIECTKCINKKRAIGNMRDKVRDNKWCVLFFQRILGQSTIMMFVPYSINITLMKLKLTHTIFLSICFLYIVYTFTHTDIHHMNMLDVYT